MKRIDELVEADLEEQFSRASGPGGQNVNKVATKVTLRHRPTNITVTVQESRSQTANRQLARERLLAALQRKHQQTSNAERQAREKARRQQAQRPQAVKRRMVELKRKRALTKQRRHSIPADD